MGGPVATTGGVYRRAKKATQRNPTMMPSEWGKGGWEAGEVWRSGGARTAMG